MSKKVLIGLTIFAVDVFIAYVWLFITETPTYVLAETRRRMAATVAVRLTVDASGEGVAAIPSLPDALRDPDRATEAREGAFTAHAVADVDLRDTGDVKRDIGFRLTLTDAKGDPARLEGETRSLAGARYLRFDRVPGESALEKRLAGTWLELPPGVFDMPLVRTGVLAEVDAGTEKKLRGLFRSTAFVSALSNLPEAQLGGNRHYHYAVRFRPEALRGFRIVSTNLREQRSPEPDELERLREEIERVSISGMELWIRKRDYFLSRALLQGTYANPETGTEVPFSVTVNLSRWNDAVTIVMPTESLPLQALLREAGEGGLTLSSGVETTDDRPQTTDIGAEGLTITTSTEERADEDPDDDGLPNELEGFYQTDPLNPDSDGDGYQDGYEVNHGFDPTGPGELFRFGL